MNQNFLLTSKRFEISKEIYNEMKNENISPIKEIKIKENLIEIKNEKQIFNKKINFNNSTSNKFYCEKLKKKLIKDLEKIHKYEINEQLNSLKNPLKENLYQKTYLIDFKNNKLNEKGKKILKQ